MSDVPISACIIAAYRSIPEVTAIYMDACRVWVITNNARYDDALMDRCIAAECAVVDRYPRMEITHLPSVLVHDLQEVIPKQARKVYTTP